MVPFVVGERCGIGIVSIVGRGELELSAFVHPQAVLTHIQNLSLALLLVGLYPELHSLVVLGIRCKVTYEDVHIGRTVQNHSLVLIIYIPGLSGRNQMAVACVVGNLFALALVHLPVTHEVGSGGRLGPLSVQLCLAIVMSHIPEGEFVDGSPDSLSDTECTHAVVGGNMVGFEERCGIGRF